MYRPPEMIDLYARYKIDFKGDSWMLGCVLYTLAFCKHPFQDQTQLAIVNGHYSFPNNSRFENKFHGLIAWILNPNPNQRPSVSEIYDGINNYDNIQNFGNYNKPVKRVPKRIDRDLTQEEIEKEILRIRAEAEFKDAPKETVKNNPQINIWNAPIPNLGSQNNFNTGWAKF